jgi:hypothetical protein
MLIANSELREFEILSLCRAGEHARVHQIGNASNRMTSNR